MGASAAGARHPARVGFLGPEGTFSEEALLATAPDGVEPVPLPTIFDCVAAVGRGEVERAVVPIENALEGSVNVTLDALAGQAGRVAIVGEVVHEVHQCLIAARKRDVAAIELVASHPQAHAQCARFLRTELSHARAVACNSTAEAVRMVAGEPERPWAAIGTRLAARLYGCDVLRAGIEDVAGNETRFVWLGRGDDPWRLPPAGDGSKTSLVFWGPGATEPGWLVRCLSEFAFRGVNLVRIESRPSREGLGTYRFFLDLEGADSDPAVAGAVEALGRHCEAVRTLGSYPAGARSGGG